MKRQPNDHRDVIPADDPNGLDVHDELHVWPAQVRALGRVHVLLWYGDDVFHRTCLLRRPSKWFCVRRLFSSSCRLRRFWRWSWLHRHNHHRPCCWWRWFLRCFFCQLHHKGRATGPDRDWSTATIAHFEDDAFWLRVDWMSRLRSGLPWCIPCLKRSVKKKGLVMWWNKIDVNQKTKWMKFGKTFLWKQIFEVNLEMKWFSVAA